MNLFSPLPGSLPAALSPEIRRLLDGVPALVEKTFPLPGRFRAALPRDVADLSRLLTSGRGGRALSYLGRPNLLSAYLRYFLPWNLYRLCRLLPALDISLAADDAVTDLGSGPLTFAAALWICRPDLRGLPLEFRCIDRSGPALEAGKKFFAALAGNSPWKIRTIRAGFDLGAASPGALVRGKPAALVCGINVFNEICGAFYRTGELERAAGQSAALLAALAAPAASILVAEPGVPLAAQFVSLLRQALLERNLPPRSPCPHCGPCPFPGGGTKSGKARWCHFAFETGGAPKDLHRLSAAAGIPKERAVLSFLFAGPAGTAAGHGDQIPVRLISAAFPLPGNRLGRYGCSERGLVLASGDPQTVGNMDSGSLVRVSCAGAQRDPKSGAIIAAFANNEH